jgi:hypothetical protein
MIGEDDKSGDFTITISKVLYIVVGKRVFATGFQKASTKEMLDLTPFRIELIIRGMKEDACIMFGFVIDGWRRGV